MKLSHRIGFFATLALSACEAEYAYVPVTSATVTEAPQHGDVRLASHGVVDIGSQTDESDRLRVIHLRMTLENKGAREWTLDTRTQRLELAGWGTSAPAFASANAGSAPPDVVVPPMGKRVVDLFFPLPTALQHESELPSFDAVWRVDAEHVIEKRTPFERMAIEPPTTFDASSDHGADYHWGPPYWYNPGFGDQGFRGAAEVPVRYFGHPVYVHDAATPAHFATHGHR